MHSQAAGAGGDEADYAQWLLIIKLANIFKFLAFFKML